MKTILIINDHSSAAEHAVKFALLIAQKQQAIVLIASTYNAKNKITEKVLAGRQADSPVNAGLPDYGVDEIIVANSSGNNFTPDVKEIDISGKNENQLIEFINQDHIWMVVKGIHNDLTKDTSTVNLNCILNRVQCPLLLVPEDWAIKSIERIAYLADLRYCRLRIVKFLEEFATPFKAEVSVAHLSAKGLPHMADDYALQVFDSDVRNHASYERLLFNNIKERNLQTAIDVIINGMHNDILAVVNHRFHFEEILGRYITDKLPFYITTPLFIFPY